MKHLLTAASLLVLCSLSAQAEMHWIWNKKPSHDKDHVSFRTTFNAPAGLTGAELIYTCDNGATASINGTAVEANPDWQKPTKVNVKSLVKPGENTITVEAGNSGSAAGLLVKLTLKTKTTEMIVESGPHWEATDTGKNAWKPAISVGKYGSGPWGTVLEGSRGKRDDPGLAIEPKNITVPEGFKVEQLYVVPKEAQGSWVALTVDPKGRLIACDQYGGLYRVSVPPTGSGDKPQVEKLPLNIEGAHGLLWAFDSLYFMKNEQAGDHGIYRITCKNNDGELDTITLLRKINGGGEHGCHSLQLSPDGKSIFFNCGNHTKLPEGELTSRAAFGSWDEDHVLPRMWDAKGHARGILAPGGYICKMDPEAKNIEIFCSGFRNEFDFAFDANGEMFAYDADMEWDIGAPWYRPTRINHCVSGGEYGWRSGSGKWPEYYEDSLPAAVNIGPGSPTGVVAGTGAKFPARYQHCIFANDWTYGTMYAIHPKADGAGYKAEKEEFVFGKPLPLTDVVINHLDGAMYFAVGGRRTQSALYRVTYEGKDSTAPAAAEPLTAAMQKRRELESLHAPHVGIAAIDTAWPSLGSSDRYLRFAARVAIERQPVSAWRERALAEKDPQASIEALIALARLGRSGALATQPEEKKPAPGASSAAILPGTPADAALQKQILSALGRIDIAKLDTGLKLQLLRAYQLAFTRLGKPDAATAGELATQLDTAYPATDASVNRELCQLLIFLGSKTVAAKTLNLMATAHDDSDAIATDELLARNAGYARAAEEMQQSRPNRQQIAYMFALRNCTTGWTPELRQTYFSWFPHARTWKGGNSFAGFIDNTRKEALANFVPAEEQNKLDELSSRVEAVVAANITPPKGPGKAYTTDDIVKLVGAGLKDRNFASGKNLFHATLCAACHHFAGDGGNIGPDLTGAGNRYTIRDLVENITEPSKVVSDLYGSHQLELKDGTMIVGRVVGEDGGKINLITNPFAPAQIVSVDAGKVRSRKDYPLSIMPPGMINMLNADEVKDLLAYLLSGGNPDDKMFAK